MNRPTICAYTCVLNEEAHAERWAASASEGDQMLWLDTGSTDDTVERAHAYGIQVHQAVVKPWRFDDARNIAMSLIPARIDIVVQLDADEVFSKGWADHFRDNPGHNRYSYWLENPTAHGWWRVKRMNANGRSGYRWRHPIHEIIEGPQPTCHLDDVVITHLPDNTKPRTSYLPMLARASAEDPSNARMAFYLGREYYFTGDWIKARAELGRYTTMPNAWHTEIGEAHRLIAKMAYKPEPELWKAIAANPNRREPFVDMAILYRNQGRGRDGLSMLSQAERRTDPGLYTSESYAWDEDSLTALTESLQAL